MNYHNIHLGGREKEHMVYVAGDLPAKVAGVRVGRVLIVRDERQVEAVAALCEGQIFRVVMATEIKPIGKGERRVR